MSEEEELMVALVQITATRERGRFWLRLRLLDGLEVDAAPHTALATSVDDACKVLHRWLGPLERPVLDSDTT